METRNNRIVIENADITFRDFSGRRYGIGSFGVGIEPELAEKLKADGWNVKPRKNFSDDPDVGERYFLPVTVRWDKFPPRIIMATNDNEVFMDESNIGIFDTAEFEKVNLVISPSKQMRAYLKSMYAIVAEDDLDRWRRKPSIEEPEDDGYPF